MITLHLPAQLSSLAKGQKQLAINASTLKEVFSELDGIAPMVRSQIFDSSGAVRRFVSLFLNDEQITGVSFSDTAVPPGSEVVIVMSVAGG